MCSFHGMLNTSKLTVSIVLLTLMGSFHTKFPQGIFHDKGFLDASDAIQFQISVMPVNIRKMKNKIINISVSSFEIIHLFHI